MKMHANSFLVLLMLSTLCQSQQSASPLPGAASTTNVQSPVTAQRVEEVAEGEVVRITANLVSVPVTVINRQGQYVVDLRQNDFRIYEDGVEQMIAHFSNVDRPFSVALLIDTSGSTQYRLDDIQNAAINFVDKLKPSDSVMVMSFDDRIQVLCKATTDRNMITKAIRRTRTAMGAWSSADAALQAMSSAPIEKPISRPLS